MAGEKRRIKDMESQIESSRISHRSALRLKVPKHPQSTSIPLMMVVATSRIKNARRPLISKALERGKIPITRHTPATSSIQGRIMAVKKEIV